MMRFFAVALVAGCGTTTFIPADDGGSTSDAPAEAADSGDMCAMLKMQVDANKAKLQMCTNPGSGGQCQSTVSDGCCPFATNVDNTTMFQALVSQYKNTCKPICTGACANPQHVCDMTFVCR